MKRWIVVAALGLTVAGGVVTPSAARASSSEWYQVYQANASGFISQIAAISKTNIWAVSQTNTAAGNTIYRPFIRHFNGRSWQAITIPHARSTADWVSASAADNVWVGGLAPGPVATTVAYRWNGARWRKMPVPRMTYLQDIVVLGPKDVWAFGDSGTVAYDVFHWNGYRWRYYLADTINFLPQDISAPSPNNIWLSGIAYSGRQQVVAAYHWNGRAWRRVSMPHIVFDNGGPAVTALSPSNVWIGWFDNTSMHSLHWNGHGWHTISLNYSADPTDVVPDGKGGYWFGAEAILRGSTWTTADVPGFTGTFGGVTRIPGTTSFLLTAGVETGSSSAERPTIFRFDL